MGMGMGTDMESFKVTAPTRADLAGGTLDIWPLYCLTSGAKTINVALDMHAVAHFEILPAIYFRCEVESHSSETFGFEKPLSLEECRRLPPSLQFPVAVISQYLEQKAYLPENLVRIRLQAEAPLRSGLGGSSSLCVAIARGLSRLYNDYVEQGWQWKMLGWVRDMEASFLQTPTGTQDYLAALFGGVNCFAYSIGDIDRVAYSESLCKGLSERLLVLFSGEMHHSGISNWELFKGALQGDAEVMSGLRSIGDIAEGLDTEFMSNNTDWKRVGQLFNEEWRIRKTMFHVETKRLEEITQFLKDQNVLGSKVCGAAQGGSLIALVEPGEKASVARACEAGGMKVLHTLMTSSGVTIHPIPSKKPAKT